MSDHKNEHPLDGYIIPTKELTKLQFEGYATAASAILVAIHNKRLKQATEDLKRGYTELLEKYKKAKSYYEGLSTEKEKDKKSKAFSDVEFLFGGISAIKEFFERHGVKA